MNNVRLVFWPPRSGASYASCVGCGWEENMLDYEILWWGQGWGWGGVGVEAEHG